MFGIIKPKPVAGPKRPVQPGKPSKPGTGCCTRPVFPIKPR